MVEPGADIVLVDALAREVEVAEDGAGAGLAHLAGLVVPDGGGLRIGLDAVARAQDLGGAEARRGVAQAAGGLVVLKGKLHVDGHAVAVLAALGRVEAGVHAAEPAGLLNPAHTVVGAVEGGGAHAGRLVAEHAGFAEPGDQRLVLARVVGDAGHFTAAAVVADRAAAREKFLCGRKVGRIDPALGKQKTEMTAGLGVPASAALLKEGEGLADGLLLTPGLVDGRKHAKRGHRAGGGLAAGAGGLGRLAGRHDHGPGSRFGRCGGSGGRGAVVWIVVAAAAAAAGAACAA